MLKITVMVILPRACIVPWRYRFVYGDYLMTH